LEGKGNGGGKGVDLLLRRGERRGGKEERGGRKGDRREEKGGEG